MKQIYNNDDLEKYRQVNGILNDEGQRIFCDRINAYLDQKDKDKEIERLNNRLKTSNDTCNYLRNTIDKAIFFIQNQELHKSNDTTGAITMKERELIDILLGSDKE